METLLIVANDRTETPEKVQYFNYQYRNRRMNEFIPQVLEEQYQTPEVAIWRYPLSFKQFVSFFNIFRIIWTKEIKLLNGWMME